MKNMLRRENARWWAPKPLLLQAAIWLVIVNALVAFMLFVLPGMVSQDDMAQIYADEASGPQSLSLRQVVDMGVIMFFKLSAFAIVIGAVILCNDSILKERESGTAAWVLSKPVSRKAFVLSKFLANGAGVLMVIILLQGIIAYILCSLKLGGPLDALTFTGGLALLGLDCLFYAFLAIAAGAFTRSRGATLGIPLLVMLGGMVLLEFVPDLGTVTPLTLGDMASMLATTGVLPAGALLPIAATALWIVAFAVAALWKFERVEL
jgi:ABC-2 type transport system permease protein